MQKKFSFPLLIALIPLLSSCAILAPVTVAGTGAALSDERSLGVQMDDKVILSRIKSAQAESTVRNMWSNVSVSVMEGRVLLVGCLASDYEMEEASRISWSIKGVKEVINEIRTENVTFSEGANDSFIANQIRAKMLVEKNFLSSNYTISVFKNTVFVMGIAQNQEEREKAIRIITNVGGVNKVVSHIILRNDPRRWNRV